MTVTKKSILLDMDGPMADFDKRRNELKITGEELCMKENSFATLPVTEGAIEAVRELTIYHDVTILTSPWFDRPQSMVEKWNWLQEFFPYFTTNKKVIFTKKKDLIHGTLLIDDHPDWNGAPSFKGRLFWFKNWKDDLKMIKVFLK